MRLNNEWNNFLQSELESDYFIELDSFIKHEYQEKIVFPEYDNIFRAFNLLSPDEIKVVIIGQDPYHGYKQANGLAFSVHKSCKIPPSLRNIYKELVDDIGCPAPENGDLTLWAKQGVLLINSVFTVISGAANSHKNKGWERFSDAVIHKLSESQENIVFILWGKPSQQKERLINSSKHYILKSTHPSPLSAYRGFFGSKPFSKSNDYLRKNNIKEVEWCLNVPRTLL